MIFMGGGGEFFSYDCLHYFCHKERKGTLLKCLVDLALEHQLATL